MASTSKQIASTAADVSVYWDNSAWQLMTSGNNMVGYWFNGASKIGCGLVFKDVAIPAGATITNAYITFVAAGSISGATVNSRITGQKAADPGDISSLSDYQARRGTDVGGANNNGRTTAQVSWDSIAAWTGSTSYNSPDIKSIIQEIIDQEGWASGNNICLFWDDHEGRSTASDNRRRAAYSYDDVPASAPTLYIEYTEEPEVDPPTVTTQAASSVTHNSAQLNGNITATGGENCSRRGFKYGKTSGSLNLDTHEDGSYGTGAFDLEVSSLDPDTTYYAQAYATNSEGTSYGSEVSFETTSAPSGTARYVDKDHASAADSGAGTEALPWKTINYAVDTASATEAGDTIYVKEAATPYNEQVVFDKSGSAGSGYITLRNYPGDDPVIDCDGIDLGNSVSGSLQGAIHIQNKNYIVVEGLEVTNSTCMGITIYQACDHVVTKDLYIHEIGTCGVYVSCTWNSLTLRPSNILIDGVECYHTNSVHDRETITAVCVDGLEIKNCKIHDTIFDGELEWPCQNGINPQGCNNMIIHHNEVYNVMDGIYIGGSSLRPESGGVDVYNNYVHGCYWPTHNLGIGLTIGFETVQNGVLTDVDFYNNIVVGNFIGFYDDLMGNNNFYVTFRLVNNTFFDNKAMEIYTKKAAAYHDDCVIRNNIIYSKTNGVYGIRYDDYATGGVAIDHNLFYNSGGSWAANNRLGTDYVTGDPLFVDSTPESAADFAIQSGSPAKDAGSSTSAPATDYVGTSRPQGESYDIGAYEYTAGVSAPTVTTEEAQNITAHSASWRGTINNTGGENCDRYGWRWGTSTGVYTSDAHFDGSFGAGYYGETVTTYGLHDGETYYYQFYARNSAGTTYGEELSFTTLADVDVPTVITLDAVNVTKETARIRGQITDDGGDSCEGRFRYREVGAASWVTTDWQNSLSTDDVFFYDLSGLNPGTEYEFQAAAQNSAGASAFTASESFTTLSTPTPDAYQVLSGGTRYRIDLRDQSGNIVAVLTDWTRLDIYKVVNGISTHILEIDGNSPNAEMFELDGQLEVWRRNINAGIPWTLEYEGFHRSHERRTLEDGNSIYVSHGVGYNHLLTRRIVCYYSSSAYTDKSGPGESVMKAYVDENAGPSATNPPRLLLSGVMPGLSIESDGEAGTTWTGTKPFIKLLDICQEVANATGVDFGIVGKGKGLFEFQAKLSPWGNDRSTSGLNPATGLNSAGNAPVVFSLAHGNMAAPEYSLNRDGEVNAVISMGTGLSSERILALKTSAVPMAESPWNQCEAARGANNEYTTNQLEAGSDAFLAENQAKESFNFGVMQTPGCLYGREYFFGDLVTARYKSIESNKKIIGVRIMVEGGKEDISLELCDV